MIWLVLSFMVVSDDNCTLKGFGNLGYRTSLILAMVSLVGVVG